MKLVVTICGFAFACLLPVRPALADEPSRDVTWQTVTTVTSVAALGSQALMPRVFYSDPASTAGWKARWHVSVIGPAMTLAALTLANEQALKDGLRSFRPGCDQANQGIGHCSDYGLMSSHAFLASSALGQGAAVFVVDTLKWSNGEVNVPSLLGNVGLPLILTAITSGGRMAGNWESGEQVAISGLTGLGFGAVMGVVYSYLARPECPYGSGVVCW